jgi:hypothetical protein
MGRGYFRSGKAVERVCGGVAAPRRTNTLEDLRSQGGKRPFQRLAEAGQVAALLLEGRKVRAPQGMALDNVQRGRPQGLVPQREVRLPRQVRVKG